MIVNKQNRFWEIDTLRGLAVIAMIYFHFMWNLWFFNLVALDVMRSSGWQIFARSIGTTFIFLMGLSLTLSYQQLQAKTGGIAVFSRYLRRGLKIFAWGLLITAITYGMFLIMSNGQSSNGFIIFGILHLLGLSTILAYPFLGRPWVALCAAVGTILVGAYIDIIVPYDSVLRNGPWLTWLGIRDLFRFMVDYYPVLPWFGIALLGVFAGHLLYPNRKPRLTLPDLSQNPLIRGLRFLGSHSLFIYLVHQPILIGGLQVWSFASGG